MTRKNIIEGIDKCLVPGVGHDPDLLLNLLETITDDMVDQEHVMEKYHKMEYMLGGDAPPDYFEKLDDDN